MNDDSYEIYKRQVLGRELYSSDEDNKRVKELGAEYAQWESMHGDKRRVIPIGPAHAKSGKDQERWLKEMDVHAADPKRRAEMQYAAKHGLDYPLKKTKVKSKEMAVSKSAFGVEHGYEEISKGPFQAFSRIGQKLFGRAPKVAAAAPKPAAPVQNFAQTARSAGQVAPPVGLAGYARANGQVAGGGVGANGGRSVASYMPKPATPTPAPATTAATTPKPPKGKGGKNGKNAAGKKSEESWGDWAKRSSWQRNTAIGAGAAGVGAVGYGTYKSGSN